MNILKIVLCCTLSIAWVQAEKINVTSKNMIAEDLKKEIHFIDDAKVVQGKSWIHGDEIIVYFDEHNQTKKYEAIGRVTFEFFEEKSHYIGNSDKVTYFPVKSVYILTGEAVIDDIINKRHVNGDEITLNMITGSAKVNGNNKKPVKFIFDLEEKN